MKKSGSSKTIIRDSPTQRGSRNPGTELAELRHRRPMLSLEKAINDQNVMDFEQRVKKRLGREAPLEHLEYTVEPKINGVSAELVYESKTLTVASTKGNGLAGEDITANIKTILSVPLSLTLAADGKSIPEILEVRAEVYMEKEALKALNGKRLNKGLSAFVDSREAAADSLIQLNPRVTAKRDLDIFCCDAGEFSELIVFTQYELMLCLQQWGFRVNRPNIRICRGIIEALDHCHHLEEIQSQFPYEIDGAIIKVNRLDLQSRLGSNSRSPRWALAFCFGGNEETAC